LLAQLVANCAGVALPEDKATVAISDAEGLWIPHNSQTKYFVPNADEAEHIVVISGSVQQPEMTVLSQQDVTVNKVDNMDGLRPIFTVKPKTEGNKQAFNADALQRAKQKVMVAGAAELVGVGRTLLDSAVSYAKEREQFGRPIGSFQGLQWKLVDMTIELETAAAAVAYAAMCVDANAEDAEQAVLSAKAEAGQAARRAARTSMQVHGGIGYTWEHGLHYALRRAYASDAFMGNHEYQFKQLGELIF
jgi:hypothetical protein